MKQERGRGLVRHPTRRYAEPPSAQPRDPVDHGCETDDDEGDAKESTHEAIVPTAPGHGQSVSLRGRG